MRLRSLQMRLARAPFPLGDDERGQEAGHEAVEEAGLGEGEAQPLQLRDLVSHLRLAGGGLDRLAEDDADADAGADRAESAADTQADRLSGGCDSTRNARRAQDQHVEQGVTPSLA